VPSYRIALTVTLNTRQGSAAGGTISFEFDHTFAPLFTIHPSMPSNFSQLRLSTPPTTLLANFTDTDTDTDTDTVTDTIKITITDTDTNKKRRSRGEVLADRGEIFRSPSTRTRSSASNSTFVDGTFGVTVWNIV
jgi:hypothetical protein